MSLKRLGDIKWKLGDIDGAENCFTRALEINERAARESGTPQAYDDLAVSYWICAIMRKPFDKELLKKAHDIYARLAERYPDNKRYSMNRDSLGAAL